jgi:hypothetical protein
VNTDDKTSWLLDAAVPPIPPRVQTPPYERIRARARRRRAGRAASVALGVAVLATGLAASMMYWPRPGTPPPAAPTNVPLATVPDGAVPIQEARVNRAGTGLTVYVNPPGDCLIFGDASPTVSETDTTVRLILRATSLPTECSRSMVAKAPVVLSRPLGARTLIDGSTGNPVPTFPDANLPVPPAPWTEVLGDFTGLDGSALDYLFTRAGAPELMIAVSHGDQLDPSPVQRVQLGHHQGVIDEWGTNSYEVDWVIGDLYYQMRLNPNEGQTVSLAQTHDIITELGWP